MGVTIGEAVGVTIAGEIDGIAIVVACEREGEAAIVVAWETLVWVSTILALRNC